MRATALREVYEPALLVAPLSSGGAHLGLIIGRQRTDLKLCQEFDFLTKTCTIKMVPQKGKA